MKASHGAAAPLDVLSPPASSRRELMGESAFAVACRELLHLHEDEVRALRARCEQLQESKISVARKESLEDIIFSRSSQSSQRERSAERASQMSQREMSEEDAVVLTRSIALATAPSKKNQSPTNAKKDESAEDSSKAVSATPQKRLSHVAESGKAAPTGSFLQQFVFGHTFELISCGMVFCNALVLAFESQYHGHSIGHTLQYNNHDVIAELQYPNGEFILNILSWIFGIGFAIEVGLRMGASLRVCVRDAWAWFDAFIVVVWAISKLDYVLPVD
eukprot:TRINITY_DN13415_c0_g1_i1.p1 TRINITY_DN13415_c0_g1~~TRINITY_DN13415_c0_g1_i1.p1  ORF type:complete len:276 (+),score=47.11 TRINITY_DN13415_c0_g1_i1:68-895(+)